MIVRFDTPELAEKRFKELQKKYCPKASLAFNFAIHIENGRENIDLLYYLHSSDAEIAVEISAHVLLNLTTAMKIVDLMQEVYKK